jgi:uncharacterized membrane protein
MGAPAIERKIRWSGLLVCIGLIVQLVTMAWAHPLSFMAFLTFGAPLMLAGVGLFLYSLVSKD